MNPTNPTAAAATYDVNSEASLNSALTAIAASDTPAVINVTGPFTITSPVTLPAKDITIEGNGAQTQITRGVKGDLFTVPAGGNLTLDNIVIDGNRTAYNASATGGAGGSLIKNSGTLTINNGTVLRNNDNSTTGVDTTGGAVNNTSTGAFTMNGGHIYRNSAVYGGGVNNNGAMVMTGGEISDNDSGAYGGAVYNSGGFDMTGGDMIGNWSGAYGGALYTTDLSKTEIGQDAAFSCNFATLAYTNDVSSNSNYNTNIQNSDWTYPFTNGYNNWDIGDPNVGSGTLAQLTTVLVNYDTNGGQPNDIPSRRVVEGGVACPLNSPEKPGYDLCGWYLDPELTIPYDGSPIDENTTLYAKWCSGPWLSPCQCKGL
jgi:hypothetical protein